jgi:cellobiose-specific phosphotransferase system component IIC
MLFGIWAVIAPFALGYSATTTAMVNDVAAGVIVLVLAIVHQMSARTAASPLVAVRARMPRVLPEPMI